MKSSFAPRPASACRQPKWWSIGARASCSKEPTRQTPPEGRPAPPATPPRRRASLLLGSLLCLAAAAACKKGDPSPPGEDAGVSRAIASADPSPTPLTAAPLALFDEMDDCVLGYRGITLDLGDPSAESRRRFAIDPLGDVEWVVREGAHFARFSSARVGYDVWLDRPLQSVALSAKVYGTGARHLAAYLDNQHIGIVRLESEKSRVVRFPVRELALPKGRHRVSLAFLGKPRGARHAQLSQGEISWLNLAETHPKATTDTPPTRTESFANVALGDAPLRSVALRKKSSLRCPLWVPPDAELRLSLGVWGQGDGQAEVVLARDEAPPLSLGIHDLSGQSGWTEIAEPLMAVSGQLVSLEITAHDATEGARVVAGEPRVEGIRPLPPQAVLTQAKHAVIILLSGLGRKHAPPASRAHGLKSVARFAQRATYFSGYRTPSTVAPAVLASLLTGKSPRRHALGDLAARLPDSEVTIAQSIRAASGRAAFFTAVPTSFADFGFNQGWERFEATSPVQDRPAIEPLTFAEAWLREKPPPQGGQLAIIHLRGGHPPFDIPPERARELPPLEYGGDLDPRRAAIQLAAVRSRPRAQLRRLLEEDWTRLEALQRSALEKQDAAMGRLFRWLQDRNLWDDALIVVMGDVTAASAPEVPFAPEGPLQEDRLHAPLLVKWPGGVLAGHEISHPVTTVDVSTTVLAALGIERPEHVEGLDLREIAAGRFPLRGRTLHATNQQLFATRAGEWLLRGEFGSVPSLCRLGHDPACVNDLLDEYPLVSQALWQWTYRNERRERERAPERTALEPSDETRAALTVWGYFHP